MDEPKSKHRELPAQPVGARRAAPLHTRFITVAAISIVTLFAIIQIITAPADAPTVDEQAHLARGLSYLRTGDLRLYIGHPPFINMLEALPLAARDDVILPLDSPSWENPDWVAFSDEFLWKRSNDVDTVIHLGRLPVILLAAGLGLLVFRFAREVAGPVAGLAAVIAFALDPNLAAHSRVATTDLGVTAFTFAAVYAWWRMAQSPRPGWMIAAGATLGLALVSKFTAALWVPLLVLTVFFMDIDRRRAWRWLIPVLALAGLTAWAVYRFEMRPVAGLGLSIPVPMASYWEELLWLVDSVNEMPYYLFSAISRAGWWYYFPVALLVKTPLPLLIGSAAGVIVWMRDRHTEPQRTGGLSPLSEITWSTRRCAAVCGALLVAPPAVYFATTLIWSFNVGYRHLLPILPHLYVLTGLAVAWAWRQRHAIARVVAAAGLVWLALSAISIYPHHLSYFNALVGGPANGYRVLVDSNLDWGQDLIRLADVVHAQGLNPVHLSYFGTAKAPYYGIEEIDLPPKPALDWHPLLPEPGWYAISVSNLTGATVPQDPDAFDYFRRREPDLRVAYSINLYHVPDARGAVAICADPAPAADPAVVQEWFGERAQRFTLFDCTRSLLLPADPGPTWVLLRGPQAEAARSTLERAGAARQYAQPHLPDQDYALHLYRLDAAASHVAAWLDVDMPDTTFGGVATLLGYGGVDEITPGRAATVHTVWRVEAPPEPLEPLSIFLHLDAPDGFTLAIADGLGAPVESWRAGDVIVQFHALPALPALPDGWQLRAGLYRVSGDQARFLTNAGADHALLGKSEDLR